MPTTNQAAPADSIATDAELTGGVLIAEDEEQNYEIIATVSTIDEGREIAAHNLRRKLTALHNDQDPGLCPYEYYVQARGRDGYRIVASFNVAELEA